MASPAPSTDSAANASMKQQEQITFRFCRECSNMLYPKEDRMTNKLMFACRTCQFSEEAQSSCVFRNNMYNTVGETAGVTQDVGSDPTVGADFFVDGGVGDGDDVAAEVPSLRDFYCTYCGSELEDEFVQLNIGGGTELAVKNESEMKWSEVDLAEMSWMEDNDLDMDGEADSGSMDTHEDKEKLHSGEVQGVHSHERNLERKSS